ncbi:hypothetical protein RDMS_01520 [Deinococcus sp. RL]|uniref:hypothetical protein n=1 Tax=Deinococcus sp. RL TaxID=1489678 RepID=UPI0004DACF56|nr:hypothetical protein [Deinococcus sp. RL]KEF35460.1 hypothetical protein RDMS_01520 [Deinococcus sp. RL]
MELRYKHDRAGDTSPLIARLTVQGAPAGADNALMGVGSATGLPDGVIDAGGWLKAANGTDPYDLTAAVEGRDPLPPLYVLRVMKGHTPVASVTFRPIVAADAAFIDVNALHRAGQALAVSPEQLASLRAAEEAALEAAQSVTAATLDLTTERQRVEDALAATAQTTQQVQDAAAEALQRAAVDVTYTTDAERNAAAPANGTRSYTLASRLNHERRNGAWVQMGEGAASAPVVNMIRRNLQARTADLANHDPGTLNMIYDDLGPLRVVPDGSAPDADGALVVQLAQGKRGIRVMPEAEGDYFGLRAGATETQNAQGIARIADWATSQRDFRIPDFLTGGGKIKLRPGIYDFAFDLGQTPIIEGNLALTGLIPRGAVLRNQGDGHALIVNGDKVGGDTDYTQNDNNLSVFHLQDVAFDLLAGRGLLLGGTIQPIVNLIRAEFRGGKGLAVDTGQSVYFLTADHCIFTGNEGALRQAPYCDLFKVQNSIFGMGKAAYLILEGPTARVQNNNFEGCLDPLAQVIIRVKRVEPTSSMKLLGNRFGPEANPAAWLTRTSPYDIAVVGEGQFQTVPGLVIAFNDFTSALRDHVEYKKDDNGQPTPEVAYAEYRKKSPILINTQVPGARIFGNTRTNYQNAEEIVSTQPALVQGMAQQPMQVDTLDDVGPNLKPVAVQTRQTQRRQTRVMPNARPSFDGYVAASGSQGVGAFPVAEWANPSLPGTLLGLMGLVVEAAVPGTEMPMWMDLPGSEIEVPLNGSGQSVGTAVYVGDGGKLVFGASIYRITRQIGVTVSGGNPCRIRIELGKNLASKEMPTSGEYPAGVLVDRIGDPVVVGPAGSRSIVTGWRRLTTGSGHVLGTDWVERRELTGT